MIWRQKFASIWKARKLQSPILPWVEFLYFSLVSRRLFTASCGCSNLVLKFNLSFNSAFRAMIRIFRMIFPTGLRTVRTDILPHKSRYISYNNSTLNLHLDPAEGNVRAQWFREFQTSFCMYNEILYFHLHNLDSSDTYTVFTFLKGFFKLFCGYAFAKFFLP